MSHLPLAHKFGFAFALIAASFTLWWMVMFAVPPIRPFFVGHHLAASNFLYLLPGDMIAIVFATAEAVRIAQKSPRFLWQGTVVTGATLAGTAISLYLAWIAPESVWGLYLMLMAATLVISIEIAGRQIPIVWGPFRFAKSLHQNRAQLIHTVTRQIVVMWGLFLIVFPVLLSQFELRLGWTSGQFRFRGQGWVGIALVTAFGLLGIAAARAMIFDGEGTPLPIAGTQRLVISGPYAYIRNPMAFAGIGQGIAVGIALGSGLVVIYALCGAILWDFCVRPLEETYLLSEFGADYAAYRDTVPCWRIRLGRK